MAEFDPTRHLSVFSPYQFGERRVDVIGCGATGSHLTLMLARLGISNIHVWDHDTVAEHNLANQCYELSHVGQPKVKAIADVCEKATGTKVTCHRQEVDGLQQFGEIVYLLTDTMSSREQIFNQGLRENFNVRLVIETRMGPDYGRIYSFSPIKPNHIEAWQLTCYKDEEAETSACGASITVGPTAQYLASIATWQLIRWFAIEQGADDTLENVIHFSLRPPLVTSGFF